MINNCTCHGRPLAALQGLQQLLDMAPDEARGFLAQVHAALQSPDADKVTHSEDP